MSGKPKKPRKKSGKENESEKADLSLFSLEKEEILNMATMKNLLAAQESTIKSLFKSFVTSINTRINDLVDDITSIKASLQFSQQHIDNLKPVKSHVDVFEIEIKKLQNSIEYLENQSRSRRNNIRVSGIPESTSESWAIKEKLGMDVHIERTHRVEKNKGNGKLAKQRERPRNIMCKIMQRLETKRGSYPRGKEG